MKEIPDINESDNPGFAEFPASMAKVWDPKTDAWSATGRFIDSYLEEIGKTDAMILNADRDHFFYPIETFLMPLVAQQFVEDDFKAWGSMVLKISGLSNVISPVSEPRETARKSAFPPCFVF